jgi:hypothetical protein
MGLIPLCGRDGGHRIVRKGLMIGAAAAFLALGVPAQAQFYAPFGSPGMLTAPEAASGAIGAGVAESTDQQRRCSQQALGRGGVQTICPGAPATPEPRR